MTTLSKTSLIATLALGASACGLMDVDPAATALTSEAFKQDLQKDWGSQTKGDRTLPRCGGPPYVMEKHYGAQGAAPNRACVARAEYASSGEKVVFVVKCAVSAYNDKRFVCLPGLNFQLQSRANIKRFSSVAEAGNAVIDHDLWMNANNIKVPPTPPEPGVVYNCVPEWCE